MAALWYNATGKGVDCVDRHADYSKRLTEWYRPVQRDLPWRRTKNPYAIWVSEIMLQQTRVETVREYYRRFMERLPDVTALSKAPQAEVLKLWEGLGYYSRARNMQRAAQMIVDQYGGRFPETAAELRKLPGIGAYTAGAVASIAFGEASPAIDGNVKRVAARLFGIREAIDAKASLRIVQDQLSAILGYGDAGEINQALMELGATVCIPRSPKCDLCPLAQNCDAFAEGDATLLPILTPKEPPKVIPLAVCLLTYAGQVLLLRRQERLLHGLYVFWLAEGDIALPLLQSSLQEQGLHTVYQGKVGEGKHIFTHRIWQMEIHHFVLTASPAPEWLQARQAAMASADEMLSLPMPTAMRAAQSLALTLLDAAE